MKRTLTTHCCLIAFLLTMVCGPATAQDANRPGILVADFEGVDYGEWKAEGEAFGDGPARGTLPGQMHVSGFEGKGLVNSFLKGDRTTGILTSPLIRIERKYLTFLVGGGGHAGKTCMNLLLDGEVVHSITGDNTQSGGSEELTPAYWDVSALAGESVTMQIVDAATSGWGHINVDQIVQTDTKPALPEFARRQKSFIARNRFLVIPVRNGGKATGQIQLFAEEKEVRNYTLNIANSAATTDWYAFFSIDAYRGQHARVAATKVTEEGFALIQQSDSIPGEGSFYTEPHRPQFHFTQKVGWNNDPNGMVYHDGTWHLFFQHNPVALPWGNMTWGHATSRDLLHWNQQPNKLFPKTMARGACFSGGATVDTNDTAGWGKNTLVAFLTDTGAGESIAYSTDGGHNFTWYEGNPVVKHSGRDPKVIWYAYSNDDQPLNDEAKELGGHWVMIVYDEHPEYKRNAAFYTSTNLKDWTEQSHLPGYFECTELFELTVDGFPNGRSAARKETEATAGSSDRSESHSGASRWVVFAADAKYAVGSFDGRTFTPEHEGKHQVHWGDYYASQTFDQAPDGRRIQIGWLRVPAPGPYNQHFSFPHRLTLRDTKDGIRMFATPIREIEQLRAHSRVAQPQRLIADEPVTLPVESDLLDVRVTVEIGNASLIEVTLPGRTVRYDTQTQTLNEVPLTPVNGQICIQVLADRSLTEIIGNDGRIYISGGGPERQQADQVAVTAIGGNAALVTFEAHELNSIWSKQTQDPDAGP